MYTTPMIDNTIHFQRYNAGVSKPSTTWEEGLTQYEFQKRRQKRSAKITSENKKNQERRKLQQTILQLLIDANHQPVHINEIAASIHRSPEATLRFLYRYNDDLWMECKGKCHFYTSLPILPDRLFY